MFVQRGIVPVSIGLVLAGCLTFAKGAIDGWLTATIAITSLAILICTSLNPALVVLGGAIIGIVAFRPH
jgi:chromate transporter